MLPRYQRYVLDLAEEKGLAVQSSVREGGETMVQSLTLLLMASR